MEEDSPGQRGSRTGSWALAAWLASAALAYFGLGEYIAYRANGLDSAHRPLAGVVAFAVAAGLAYWLTTRWGASLGDELPEAERPSNGRRVTLYLLALGGGTLAVGGGVFARTAGWLQVTDRVTRGPGVAATHPERPPSWQGARVRAYRRLGRTDFAVSDISLGSGAIPGDGRGERIAREAIERGVNYFDTAPDYAGSGTERVLGRALAGRRDQMFVATKFCTADGHLRAGASVGEYMSAVEGSLERLGTDYVDLVHVHACDSRRRLLDENLHEAFDRLREQGKTRFLGFSSHTPNLPAVATAAIESDRFDVMMLAYHHGVWPTLAAVVDSAAAHDVGVVAMKTLKGAKHRGISEFVGREGAYSQAAFRWVLSNPSVSCLVISFYKQRHLDEYLYASGTALEPADVALLDDYDHAVAGTHCLPHCDACLEHCPEGVPIADVLRHRMYFEDYGLEKQAMELYAALDRSADACVGCAAPCLGTCPVGLPIQERTSGAHQLLTLS